jgi:mannose/cellobiose epimerase-like protein (N-acyl-D-glucosamine 2-epimerase family)
MADHAEPHVRFEYVVWFRDERFTPDDEDYEWPACIWIDAASADEALAGGDHLARAYSARCGKEAVFLSSHLDPPTPGADLPVVRAGEQASDEHIGW